MHEETHEETSTSTQVRFLDVDTSPYPQNYDLPRHLDPVESCG